MAAGAITPNAMGTLLHLNRVGYRLDGAAAIADPRGMAGKRWARICTR